MKLLLCLSLVSLAVAFPRPLTEDDLVMPGEEVNQPESPLEKFVRSDANRDRSLTFDEFLHMDRLYEQAKKEEFDYYDTNGDGRISKDEYDEYHRSQNTRSDNLKAVYFGQIFEQYDKDHNAHLSEEEVKQLLRERFLVEPRNTFPKIFYGFDTDKDGGLDLAEYMKLDEKFPFEQTDPIKTAPVPNELIKREKQPMEKNVQSI